MSKTSILITGANGEMGHGLIQSLQKNKKYIIVAMDLNRLDNSISRFCSEKIIGDILDKDLIKTINKKFNFSTIYHLAALLSTKAEIYPQLAHDINVNGTINLLNMALKQSSSQGKIIKFFFPSSIAVYGLKNLKEKYFAGSVEENKYQNPSTIYGCNKLYCEHLGNYYSNYYKRLNLNDKKYNIDFRSIRFPGIISSKTIPTSGTSDYIPEMLHSVAQGKKYDCFVRKDTQIPFMTMPDAVKAIIQLMKSSHENLKQNVYNIRSFSPTVEEFEINLLKFFPKAIINYVVNEKKQKMIDGWPMDTNDNAAKYDWKWEPSHSLYLALKEYLVPELKLMYS